MQEKVHMLLEKALAEHPELFLIDFTVGSANQISITIDGDNGVSVEDCISISRAIEHNLDREEEDFSLEVSSVGATTPLQLPRQYKKNVGRKISVKTQGDHIEADLIAADDDAIELKWKVREPKPVGKGKHTVIKEEKIPYNTIVEAKVMIKF